MVISQAYLPKTHHPLRVLQFENYINSRSSSFPDITFTIWSYIHTSFGRKHTPPNDHLSRYLSKCSGTFVVYLGWIESLALGNKIAIQMSQYYNWVIISDVFWTPESLDQFPPRGRRQNPIMPTDVGRSRSSQRAVSAP